MVGRKFTAKRRPTPVAIVSSMNSVTPVSVQPVKTSDTAQSDYDDAKNTSEWAKSGLAPGGASRQRVLNSQQTNGEAEAAIKVFAERQVGECHRRTASTITDVARRWGGRRGAPRLRRRPATTSRRSARQALRGVLARLQWRCQLPVLIATAPPNSQKMPPALCSLQATARAELAMCFAVLRRLW
jgi:hypothetical protein